MLRKLAGLWNERALRLIDLGSAVRVDHRQFPVVHRAYADATSALDVRDLPELFVLANPVPDATAIGIDAPFVVITSAWSTSSTGWHALRARPRARSRRIRPRPPHHDAAAAAAGVRHHLVAAARRPRVPGDVAALHEWARTAELSGDRAGLLARPAPRGALRVHMALASGGRLGDVRTTAFQAQGDEHPASPDGRDSLLKLLRSRRGATRSPSFVPLSSAAGSTTGPTPHLQGKYPSARTTPPRPPAKTSPGPPVRTRAPSSARRTPWARSSATSVAVSAP